MNNKTHPFILWLTMGVCLFLLTHCPDVELEPDEEDESSQKRGDEGVPRSTDFLTGEEQPRPQDTDALVDDRDDYTGGVPRGTDVTAGDDIARPQDTDALVDEDTGAPSIDTDSGEDDRLVGYCTATQYTEDVEAVNVMILLDRSETMNSALYEQETHEMIVDGAIKELVNTPSYEAVNFGLATFPSRECQQGEPVSSFEGLCQPADEWLVEMGPGNADAIATQLKELDTCGGTPLCSSLSWAEKQLSNLKGNIKENPTYILLVTDGVPNCNRDLSVDGCVSSNPDPLVELLDASQCVDDRCVVDMATRLFEANVELFVVGVGEDIKLWNNTMEAIAQAGSGGRRGYHSATSPRDLDSALTTIFDAIVPEVVCQHDIRWEDIPGERGETKGCDKVKIEIPLTPEEADEEGVEWGWKSIPYSPACADPSGWHWIGDETGVPPLPTDLGACSTVALCPNSCEDMRISSQQSITVWFGCAE